MATLSNKAFQRNSDDPSRTKNLSVSSESRIKKIIKLISKQLLNLIEEYMKSNNQNKEIILLQQDITMEEVQKEMDKLKPILINRFKQLLKSSTKQSYQRGITASQNEIDRITGSKGSKQVTAKDNALLKLINDTNFAFIKTISNRHIDQAKRIFTEGLVNGLNQKQITQEISEQTNTTEIEARRIVRTELTRSSNTASRKRYLDSGLTYWQWTTAMDERVCPVCSGLDGVVAKIGKPFNKYLTAAGQRKNKGNIIYQPPAHPNCRCGVSPAFRKDKPEPEKKPEPKPKFLGFVKDFIKGVLNKLKLLPKQIRSSVKSLNGSTKIIKTKGKLVDDARVKAVVSPSVLNKFRDATGFYVGGDFNQIFVSDDSDKNELYHEVGHSVYKEYLTLKSKTFGRWLQIHNILLDNGEFISSRSSISPSEHFADAFRYYINNPIKLRFKFPEVYEYMRKNIFFGNESDEIVTLEDNNFIMKNRSKLWIRYVYINDKYIRDDNHEC